MFTLQFKGKKAGPKYDQLYRYVRAGIVSGMFSAGERLPSKRTLAAHLRVSMNTVENAYGQLIAEGYVESVEKRGYFVLAVSGKPASQAQLSEVPRVPERKTKIVPSFRYDMKNNAVDTASFPFATWSKLMRECLRADHSTLLRELEPQGDRQLREAIAGYLKGYRDIHVTPDQIVVGAGTSYLLGVLTELLPSATFAVESPGYPAIARTLEGRKVCCAAIPVDGEGLSLAHLEKSGASVCILTPSNQFPLGTVMSITRRVQLLEWAEKDAGRYLVEDDYDSDYRYTLKSSPAMYTLAPDRSVVYLDTFTRTLTPSLRIAYMVLPERLLAAYQEKRHFFSCSVSAFEQRTLWRFIKGGHYERHLNRMRTLYRKRRNVFLNGLMPLHTAFTFSGIDAGLHLLIRSTKGLSEQRMIERAGEQQVKVYGLSAFYHGSVDETNTVVAGYGGLDDGNLKKAAAGLCRAWG